MEEQIEVTSARFGNGTSGQSRSVADGERTGAAKGSILVLTEDLSLVVALRHGLLRDGYDLIWNNNFWLALSDLHDTRFKALIFDLRANSVEERFVVQFLEEYEHGSSGKKVFLASPSSSAPLRRQMTKLGHAVISDPVAAPDVIQALDLAQKLTWNIRSSLY